MNPDDFYHEDVRVLQTDLGTKQLADHIAENYVEDRLATEHRKWIEKADSVFLATVDPQGNPECSYKGGLPGFITVPNEQTLEIPGYNGNGMYRSWGNAKATGRIGMVFLFPEHHAKLRINGSCEVLLGKSALERHHGADSVLRVTTREVFENCPRYLHDPVTGTHSKYCPNPGYTPPVPDWKKKPEYRPIIRL